MFATWLSTLTDAAVATAQTASATQSLTALPMVTRGLLTTLFGLLGVFLVLLLFFGAIKLMQNIREKPEDAKE